MHHGAVDQWSTLIWHSNVITKSKQTFQPQLSIFEQTVHLSVFENHLGMCNKIFYEYMALGAMGEGAYYAHHNITMKGMWKQTVGSDK